MDEFIQRIARGAQVSALVQRLARDAGHTMIRAGNGPIPRVPLYAYHLSEQGIKSPFEAVACPCGMVTCRWRLLALDG